MSVKEFIESNYRVIWSHPQATEEDWDTFLLGERHDYEKGKAVNELFISHFSTPGSALLVEGQVSLQNPVRAQRYMKAIQTPHLIPDRVFGWDIDYFLELITRKLNEGAEHFLKECVHDFTVLSRIDWEKELAPLFNMVVWDNFLPADAEQKKILVRKAIKDMVQEMNDFVQTEARPLLEKCQQDAKTFADMEALLQANAESLKNALQHLLAAAGEENDIADLAEKANNLQSQLNQYRDYVSSEFLRNRSALSDLLLNKMRELEKRDSASSADFPERTQSMVTTLNRVREYIEQPSARIFLIAGSNHLEEDDDCPPEERELCSLTPLYLFLQDHKNTILLKPKVVDEESRRSKAQLVELKNKLEKEQQQPTPAFTNYLIETLQSILEQHIEDTTPLLEVDWEQILADWMNLKDLATRSPALEQQVLLIKESISRIAQEMNDFCHGQMEPLLEKQRQNLQIRDEKRAVLRDLNLQSLEPLEARELEILRLKIEIEQLNLEDCQDELQFNTIRLKRLVKSKISELDGRKMKVETAPESTESMVVAVLKSVQQYLEHR